VFCASVTVHVWRPLKIGRTRIVSVRGEAKLGRTYIIAAKSK
jgi:hypothetical protein